ncbi:interleukin-8-like [Heptranchias perlo]|uniref:interleukin-8-like n=1 Tax=Heptranchias perlo TaxID=212740 RepID=UPI00355A40AF
MNSEVTVTVLTLFVLYVASIQASSVGGKRMDLRCQCIKTSSKFISRKRMESIEIIANGPHCANVEIVVRLKNNHQVCLDPKTSWVKAILNRLTNVSKKTNKVHSKKE